MTFAPKFLASHSILALKDAKTSQTNANVVELYLDYCCPFSKKLYLKWTQDVIPTIEHKLNRKFEFRLLHVPQPWHPSSALMHEAALAVAEIDPGSFQDFSKALFENQDEFFDQGCYNKTRNQMYQELASLAEEVGVSADEVMSRLEIDVNSKGDSSLAKNIGNKVARDIKHFVRYHRQNGVHITPTVAVNGIILGNIGSGNTPDEVVELLGAAT
ncbi:LANO_0F12794g1_1 [Lachancea nothofagi CBS 11611]|uniref:LANO_0F12794g1_1 n=1 Tax=Lachancea nothofagi CBS 11611 TaxID=1266666 RepID=A0A1G4KBF5_9SACH|nr:LANO_0F12794g1_1 [Lachancea nothofagi CBS 11611]